MNFIKSPERYLPHFTQKKLASTCAALVLLAQPLFASISTDSLRCEYLTDPRGIDTTKPRLSWIVESKDRGEVQTAYQILVASSVELLVQDQADLWDSGKMNGDATSQISYAGKALKSGMQCYWKVRSWSKEGIASDWSKPASWTVGLLDASDWSAKWIDASERMPRQALQGTPKIVSATYRAINGAGSFDATRKLQKLEKDGSFQLNVGNPSIGADPAYGQVKELRVVYEIEGKKASRTFPEKFDVTFPDDFSPPPTIVRATYEAVDGGGSADVTEVIVKLADNGYFDVPVNNITMGSDPALQRKKLLRVEFLLNGKTQSRTIAEDTKFSFPNDLLKARTVPYLRRGFNVGKPIARATIHATALGIYELRLNGQRVGDHVLASEWTDYNKRLRYQEYDVTNLVKEGANALGAQVANGWYSGHIGNGGFQYWGTSPALFAQLELIYQDGSLERIITDSTWKSHASPLLSTDFMMGENYDATKEIPGWDKPGFDDSAWGTVVERAEPARKLNGQTMEPVRELMELKAKTLTEPQPGKWTYDMGQNMVGVLRLSVQAPAGTQITLRHGEMLNPDGTLYTANLRGAPSIDTYICKGGGVETWQPKLTFHGFRYVELSGVKVKPPLDAVTGVVIGSDTPQAGSFSCSDPRINQLQSNIEWGQRGNYLSVPTDCPQRDERLGWMGDAQVFVGTAIYNFDVAAFFTKWLVDVTDSQVTDGRFADVSPFAGPSSGTPAWGDAGVICPWTIYQTYGDRQLLERQYPSMTAWVDWCSKQSTDFIRTGSRGNDYGDWLSIGADTDKELLGTAYYAYSTSLVVKAAAALGKSADVDTYAKLFDSIKKAFIAKYVSPDGHIKGNTQTAWLVALKFDLLPDDLRAKAMDLLVKDIVAKDNHLSTGFVGVSYLLPELSKAGKIDTAYRLLMQDTFPSWLFSVKMGATTIWERWDGWTPDKGFQNIGMNSFNHYSLGSCGEWLYRSVGGIGADPAEPGFKKIIIHPLVGGGLTEAKATYRSIHGLIGSEWKTSDGSFTLNTLIPANTTATVYVPTKDATHVRESGKPISEAPGVTFLRMENDAAVFEVGSGHYQFTSR